LTTLNLKNLIGLEVRQTEQFLAENGVDDFKFIYYVDKKQRNFDKEIVTSAKYVGETLELTVSPMKFAVAENL